MKEPHRMRLRNGITTVNRITGETGPTYGEYVLASDYDEAIKKIDKLERAFEWYQNQHTLHMSLDLTYIVDGYVLERVHEDGSLCWSVRGNTLLECIEHVQAMTGTKGT